MKKYLLSVLLFCATSAYGQIGSLETTFKLTSVNGFAVPYQNGMVVPSFEKQPRMMISLGGQWKKLRFNANHDLSLTKRDSAGMAQVLAEAAGKDSPYFDDGAWLTTQIPFPENGLFATEKVPEFYENGVWYRTKFSTPDSFKTKFTKLIFYSVNYIADVWLNGHYLGAHEGGYTPFAFDVSSVLRSDSANVLCVRVDNIPWGSRQDIVPFYPCDWFNYTGIIHDVYLETSDPVSVARADVVPQNITGLTTATIVVKNKNLSTETVDVSLQVFKAKKDTVSLSKEITADLAGPLAAIEGTTKQSLTIAPDSISVFQTNITISNPDLWSPKLPNLYVLKVTISKGGVVRDEFYTQFGVRTLATRGNRMLLNDKEVFLHGVARHEEHPAYGRSVPLDVIFSDMKTVKSLNANYIRTAHYPNHPFTYLVADRLGLMVMEEIPVWWFDLASAWVIQNVARKVHLQMFREMVFRDYNRPSIALWSTSNECKDVGGRSTFLQMVKADMKGKYFDGRLIMQSAAADRPGAYDPSQAYTDVAGWTLYFGVFYDPYKVGIYTATKYFLTDASDFYPDKPIFDTEYGVWSGEDMTQFANQNKIFDSTFAAFKKRFPITETGTYNYNGFLAGITWWCIFDWYSHQHAYGFQSMGLIRMNRSEIKPVGTQLKLNYKFFADHSEYITGVQQEPTATLPVEFALHQNYPNPFNPSTKITFSIPVASPVDITVYNVLGEQVAAIVHETLGPGTYSRNWDARNLSSGIYFYRIQAGSYSETKKMLLLK